MKIEDVVEGRRYRYRGGRVIVVTCIDHVSEYEPDGFPSICGHFEEEDSRWWHSFAAEELEEVRGE